MYPVSASAIDKFDTCQRRWAFHYIEGDKEEAAASAELGKEMHSIGELYLKEGTYPDRLTQAGNMFIAGLPYLPAPKSGGVEGGIDIVLDGVRYIGYIDYFGPLPARARFMGLELDTGDVTLDHKTSSNPTKYGLWTREAFLNNPQAVIYGTHDVLTRNADETRLRWLYYNSKGPAKAKPSDAVLLRHELEDVFERVVHSKAKEIVRLKTLKVDPNSLEPNTESCNKYNKPCPYKAKCVLTLAQQFKHKPKTKTKTKKENDTMGLLDKIKAEKAAGAATPAQTEQKEDKINPPETEKVTSIRPAAKAENKTAEAAVVRTASGVDAHKVADVLEAIARLLRG